MKGWIKSADIMMEVLDEDNPVEEHNDKTENISMNMWVLGQANLTLKSMGNMEKLCDHPPKISCRFLPLSSKPDGY